jgi:hypothetical protein
MTPEERRKEYYERHNCDSMLGKLCRMKNASPLCTSFLMVQRSLNHVVGYYDVGYRYVILYDNGQTYDSAMFLLDAIEEVPRG